MQPNLAVSELRAADTWLADRRASYVRDVLVELARGLPATTRWIAVAVVAASGGGATLLWLVTRASGGYAA